MREREESHVVIESFPGLIDSVDPNDLPPGAARLQVNVTSSTPGQLQVRSGHLPCSFETTITETV